MSISDYELTTRIMAGDLTLLESYRLGPYTQRMVLLTRSMASSLIDGPWDNENHKTRLRGNLRADLGRFVDGNKLRISLGGRKSAFEDMKKLGDLYEVWEFKSDLPNSKIRVFGRFAGRNTFVATNWQWRHLLGNYGSDEWKVETDSCLDKWASLFQKLSPHTGDIVDAYLSDADDVTLYTEGNNIG